ncbi:MAG: twin-arginine translocase subunit TatC, partial [Gammaproteobacteria bacterium]|nr:twin-arginine translocase subunit TatC [Gammaproteobacteria bacterium]
MTTTNRPQNSGNTNMPFLAHLVELRDRLLRIVLAVFIIFLGLFPFANELYLHVAEPLLSHLPEGASMIATEVASPFLTPFKLTLVMAIFLAMPMVLFQGWSFVAPGLYRHERRVVMPLMVVSIVLFYTGMLFAYYVVFPLVFGFFTSVAPEGVAVTTDIARYLDFVLKLFFAFGLAFEVPIVAIVLVWTGVSTPESMAQKRPYIIVGAFVFGMLLTPPDVVSQTLLALPMWILFEIGIFFSRSFVRSDGEADDSGDDEDGEIDGEAPDDWDEDP